MIRIRKVFSDVICKWICRVWAVVPIPIHIVKHDQPLSVVWLRKLALILLSELIEYVLLISEIWLAGILSANLAILSFRLTSLLSLSQNTELNLWWCRRVNSTVSCVLSISPSL